MSLSLQTLYSILIPTLFILHYISLLLFKKTENFINPRHTILFVFTFSLLIRFIVISFFPFASGYDISSFERAVENVIEGRDIYSSLDFRHFYAFFPGYALFLSLFTIIGKSYSLPFVFIEKLPIVIFDSGISVLLNIITKRKIPSLVYAVSPIPLTVGALFGQFDPIVLFFIILSFYIFTKKREIVSFIMLGIAITIKPWAVLFSLVLFPKSRQLLLSLLALVSPLVIVIIIYLFSIQTFSIKTIKTMFLGIIIYTSVVGWWGPSVLFKIPAFLLKSEFPLVVWGAVTKLASVVLIISVSLVKKESSYKLAMWFILIIYVFSAGMSIHYLYWIFPFVLINNSRFTKSYIVFIGSFIILVGAVGGLTYQFNPPHIPSVISSIFTQILWLYFLFWFLFEIRQTLRGYVLKGL